MIINIEEAKKWMRDIPEEENDIIEMLIGAAEEYLKGATGVAFDTTNNRAKIFCLVLVTDWYENRDLIGSRPSEKMRMSIQSMLTQLQNLPDEGEEISGI